MKPLDQGALFLALSGNAMGTRECPCVLMSVLSRASPVAAGAPQLRY